MQKSLLVTDVIIGAKRLRCDHRIVAEVPLLGTVRVVEARPVAPVAGYVPFHES